MANGNSKQFSGGLSAEALAELEIASGTLDDQAAEPDL